MSFPTDDAAARLFCINRLPWRTAVALAVEAGRIYGIKQAVFKHPLYGWTWRSIEEYLARGDALDSETLARLITELQELPAEAADPVAQAV